MGVNGYMAEANFCQVLLKLGQFFFEVPNNVAQVGFNEKEKYILKYFWFLVKLY